MLGEQINYMLESRNGKIKSVCTGFASLDSANCSLHSVCCVADVPKPALYINRSTVSTKATTEDRRYEEFVTAHAYSHFLAEIAKRGPVQFPGEVGAPVPSPEGPLTVTDDSYTCTFRFTFRLPCRHMVVHRQMSGK